MTHDEGRRFTDREVALVLKKASEIEERREAQAGGRGLSLRDLEEIAREVGISPDAVTRAVASLERRPDRASLMEGAPATRKAVRAIPAELDREALGRLIRRVDAEAEYSGVVSEAVGSVRWSGGDRYNSMTVSLTPEAGETTIEVVEKSNQRIRRVAHLLPAGWATILTAGIVSSFEPTAGALVGALIAGAAAGGGVGRMVWNAFSRKSARRVERLAALLSREGSSAGPTEKPDALPSSAGAARGPGDPASADGPPKGPEDPDGD